MILFLRFSVGYFLISMLSAFFARNNTYETMANVFHLMGNGSLIVFFIAFTFACFGLAMNAINYTRPHRAIIMDTLQAAIAILYFQAGFMIFKTTMPFIVPFYADPALAKIDAVLHFGTDPWTLAHRWKDAVPVDFLAGVYLFGWLWPAALLPIILAALDSDSRRVQHMLILYILSWVLIGNALALIGMSAGPIYFERIYSGNLFADLPISFLPVSPNMQIIRDTQEGLWIAFTQTGQAKGSGISAFPSVHLSVATLTAIYVYERSHYLLPVAVIGVTAILFMSVYSGYHYAIDGYVSISIVIGFWLYLRRRERQSLQ